jgi:hypothetical protein
VMIILSYSQSRKRGAITRYFFSKASRECCSASTSSATLDGDDTPRVVSRPPAGRFLFSRTSGMVMDAVGCTKKQSITYMILPVELIILPVELKNSRLSGPDSVHLRSFTHKIES